MKGLLIAFTVLLFSFESFSAEDNSESVEFVKKDQIYDCDVQKAEIEKRLSTPQECTIDADCVYFNYGYPWQPAACIKAIISKMDEDLIIYNLSLIDQYDKVCIEGNEEENLKASKLAQEIEEENCNMIRLYCYKGYCRSKNYSVQTNDTPLRQLR